MIIISNGQYKSGSTLIHNYNCLLANNRNINSLHRLFKDDLIPVLDHIHIEFSLFSIRSFLKLYWFKNFFTLFKLIYANFRYGDFAIKTHGRPTFFWLILIKLNLARVTYTFRDPRDIILSLIDHGEKSRKGLDPVNAFIKCDNIENTLSVVTSTIDTYKSWQKLDKNILFLKYEEIMTNPNKIINEISSFLGYKMSAQDLQDIIDIENEKKNKGGSYNFNSGKINRYKSEFDIATQNQLYNFFKEDLNSMGYE
ncbi:MAG: sulfotransferase domain-containing protein [Algoriphagus sp.]|uniref:sulfotransferase domain-containing protein n=1 Tax=Algoriphagus sp. TaxID=1872435 RepID=UPI00185B9C79|nr:sulfotransferase domain-containing protein [Algoriphagus sp.]NVJ86002.1 sulfotransferase domain-containing protein [Algoriphagus sp.]